MSRVLHKLGIFDGRAEIPLFRVGNPGIKYGGRPIFHVQTAFLVFGKLRQKDFHGFLIRAGAGIDAALRVHDPGLAVVKVQLCHDLMELFQGDGGVEEAVYLVPLIPQGVADQGDLRLVGPGDHRG